MKCNFCENPKYVERINSKGVLENFCVSCIEKLIKVPHDYNESTVRYDEESIEVLSVTRV